MKNNSIIIVTLFLMLPWNAFAALNERQKNDYRARAHAATTQSQVEQIIAEASKIGNFNPRIDAPFIEELKAIAQGMGGAPTPPPGLKPDFTTAPEYATFDMLVRTIPDVTRATPAQLDEITARYNALFNASKSNQYNNPVIPPQFERLHNEALSAKTGGAPLPTPTPPSVADFVKSKEFTNFADDLGKFTDKLKQMDPTVYPTAKAALTAKIAA